jgi:hypothetical protein
LVDIARSYNVSHSTMVSTVWRSLPDFQEGKLNNVVRLPTRMSMRTAGPGLKVQLGVPQDGWRCVTNAGLTTANYDGALRHGRCHGSLASF